MRVHARAPQAKNAELQRENAALRIKVQDMLQVIRAAAVADEEENETEVLIESLQRENAGLRSLLDIAGESTPQTAQANGEPS